MRFLSQIVFFILLSVSKPIELSAHKTPLESYVKKGILEKNGDLAMRPPHFHPLLNAQGLPGPELTEIFSLLGFENAQSGSLTEFNSWAQAHLIRKGERWETQAKHFEGLKQKLEPLLTSLGFIKEVWPFHRNYQGAVVHGGFFTRAHLRLTFLVRLWEEGVRFKELYFLSGARALDPKLENIQALNSLIGLDTSIKSPPQTETEMMRYLWDHMKIPSDMRNRLKIHFIDAPMKKDPLSDRLIRPTTEDTIHEWLKLKPSLGSYLAITNVPYIPRQDLVIKALTPEGYQFETVGIQETEQESIAIILDELARAIYQIHKCY